MSINIQMKQKQSDGSYENLYPVAVPQETPYTIFISTTTLENNAVVKCTKGTSEYTAILISENLWMCYADSSGDWIVRGYIQNVLVTNLATVSLTSVLIAETIELTRIKFSTSSWDEINTISSSGNANILFSIGDTKSVDTTLGTFGLQIVGFNHDTKTSGGTAGISLMMKNITLNTPTAKMKSNATNSGGWDSTSLYTYCNDTFYNALPSDLKSSVKQVVKQTSAGNQSSTIETSNNYCWLASYTEVGFTATGEYSPGGEGTAYDIFTNNKSRIKYLSNGTAQSWWLRSPYLDNTTYFCYVYTNGTEFRSDASASNGVVVGLCI